jgi:tRNA-dihydrouridine synthase B
MKLPKSFLAPIFGFSNVPFRLLCQRYECKASYVPLVHVSQVKNSVKNIEAMEQEKGLGIQLSGSNPEQFAEAVRIIERKFPFIERFDVNCGCPSQKASDCRLGAALMKKPEVIAKIIASVKKETDNPVSVKTRIFQDKARTLSLAEAIESAGADFIIIHGRTPEQGYSGQANWSMMRDINDSISIPLVGNGDITSLKQGKERVRDGFCDSFMIGRAAMSNPLLFKGKDKVGKSERKKIFFEYLSICKNLEEVELSDLRLKIVQFFKGFEGSAAFRNNLFKSKTLEELLKRVSGDR